MKRAMVLGGLMGLMLLCGCGKKANSEPAGSAWSGFDPEQGKFSVNMPGTPAEKALDESTGKVWTSTENGLTYSIQYKELQIPAGTDQSDQAEQIMDDDIDWSARTQGGTITGQKKPLIVGGLPGREVDIDDGATVRRVRMCLAGNRLYSVTVSGPKANVDGRDVDAFLDSFKLAKEASH